MKNILTVTLLLAALCGSITAATEVVKQRKASTVVFGSDVAINTLRLAVKTGWLAYDATPGLYQVTITEGVKNEVYVRCDHEGVDWITVELNGGELVVSSSEKMFDNWLTSFVGIKSLPDYNIVITLADLGHLTSIINEGTSDLQIHALNGAGAVSVAASHRGKIGIHDLQAKTLLITGEDTSALKFDQVRSQNATITLSSGATLSIHEIGQEHSLSLEQDGMSTFNATVVDGGENVHFALKGASKNNIVSQLKGRNVTVIASGMASAFLETIYAQKALLQTTGAASVQCNTLDAEQQNIDQAGLSKIQVGKYVNATYRHERGGLLTGLRK